ncbi:MAG: hypothetical protein KKF68_03500 [Nanoarchaeota archaeon]|nr:hypothetical protein [Nanoarchaeota archaeon]
MNKWIKLLLGLVVVVGAIYFSWGINDLFGLGSSALIVLKGGLVWFAIMMGLLLVMLGVSDLKE